MNIDLLKKKITDIFKKYSIYQNKNTITSLLPKFLTSGKLYEAFILGIIAQKLVTLEQYRLVLINSNYVHLKSSHGPINRIYPRIDVLDKSNIKKFEIWTDVEFISLSYQYQSQTSALDKSFYHELDIVLVEPNINGRPNNDNISLGIECKNTVFNKRMLKEILGVRRELSFLSGNYRTGFMNWPRKLINANPPICLQVYSTDNNIQSYKSSADFYGIDLIYQKLF